MISIQFCTRIESQPADLTQLISDQPLSAMSSVSVALGNVMLGAGQYVAFLQATSDGYTSWGSVAADAYAGGALCSRTI
ncbi:MAG: hypothetical protein ACK4GC_00430, partial [Paracoccaceae bacterium]